MTGKGEHFGVVLRFPCCHARYRQQRTDRSLMPCAWPGCSDGLPEKTTLFLDRINPPFHHTFERRVTGGGTSPLVYLWKVIIPPRSSGAASGVTYNPL